MGIVTEIIKKGLNLQEEDVLCSVTEQTSSRELITSGVKCRKISQPGL